jgi:hypothetical protein
VTRPVFCRRLTRSRTICVMPPILCVSGPAAEFMLQEHPDVCSVNSGKGGLFYCRELSAEERRRPVLEIVGQALADDQTWRRAMAVGNREPERVCLLNCEWHELPEHLSADVRPPITGEMCRGWPSKHLGAA